MVDHFKLNIEVELDCRKGLNVRMLGIGDQKCLANEGQKDVVLVCVGLACESVLECDLLLVETGNGEIVDRVEEA